jgi:MoaD family protein
MRIQVKGYLTLRGVIGDQPAREIEAEQATIRDLLQQLSLELGQEFTQIFFDPETGEPNRLVSVLVNGRHYTHLPDGLDTILADGDEVALFPPAAGG